MWRLLTVQSVKTKRLQCSEIDGTIYIMPIPAPEFRDHGSKNVNAGGRGRDAVRRGPLNRAWPLHA